MVHWIDMERIDESSANNAGINMNNLKRKNRLTYINTLLKENAKYTDNIKKLEKGKQLVSYRSAIYLLYRYASLGDVLLMACGLLAAMINGLILPWMSLLFGGLANVFLSQEKYADDPRYKLNLTLDSLQYSTLSYSPNSNGLPADFITEEYYFEAVKSFTFYYIYIGILILISGAFLASSWEISCSNRIRKLKQIYFAQILRQDLSWYDENVNGDLVNKITEDLERMRDGLGSKVPLLFQTFATFISGIVTGLIVNWRLSMVILIGGPVILFFSGYNGKKSAESALREQIRYGIAGKIATEVLTNIRTITAFGTQDIEIKRFNQALADGLKASLKQYFVMAFTMSISTAFLYIMYGIGVWYGGVLFLHHNITPGQMFAVFMSVITGALSIGNALPLMSEVASGIGCAVNVFSVIASIPKIDPYSNDGNLLEKHGGEIELRDVYFHYPTRPETMILCDLNLVIQPGQVIAMVGASGSGKSTIINLLLRFYDPICGNVFLDGVNIKNLNITSLRKNIGFVSQEPVLFDVSIEENIRYGNANATDYEIVAAARLSNAHNFIVNMPKRYKTIVGERGVQLSGGQKQRIAIARALVSNPKILLLDEATSALDAQSETVVQTALENAMQGRTTIIVAHRLSTVRNADVICTMKEGKIIEKGTHNELMDMKGVYYNLVVTQKKQASIEEQTDVDPLELQPVLPVKRISMKRRSSRKKSVNSKAAGSIDGQSEISEQDEEELVVTYRDILSVVKNKRLAFIGGVACLLSGFHIPVFSILYGEVYALFTVSNDDFYRTAIVLCSWFIALAVGTGITLFISVVTWSISTEYTVKEMRQRIFKNLLSLEVCLFDIHEYSPSNLINILSKDASIIRSLTGVRAGFMLLYFVTIFATIALIFYYGWRLALIIIAFWPLMFYFNLLQNKMKYSTFIKESKAAAKASKVASECVQNVKTVQSLCLQEHMVKEFTEHISAARREELRTGIVYGIAFGVSLSILQFAFACVYRYGATLISDKSMIATDMYRITFAISFAATTFTVITLLFLDIAKSKVALTNSMRLIHMESELNPFSTEGTKQEIKGKIEFKDIWFSYPTRHHQRILRGLDLTIEPGQTVALVGGSGCGKSTVISLLERFYFPRRGNILLDGVNITDINVGHLRNHLGLVTQEPTLFDTTIRENIAYGAKSLENSITEQDIIKAAKAANIHDFIIKLPQGYETKVGDRGSKLSGGQKQRIAIARALVRNPKILLLDEATSALDTESEMIVQIALDKAREGRTCIIIAHRLSTVQNADKIAVIHNGIIAELGTHDELKSLGGLYYELIKNQ